MAIVVVVPGSGCREGGQSSVLEFLDVRQRAGRQLAEGAEGLCPLGGGAAPLLPGLLVAPPVAVCRILDVEDVTSGSVSRVEVLADTFEFGGLFARSCQVSTDSCRFLPALSCQRRALFELTQWALP